MLRAKLLCMYVNLFVFGFLQAVCSTTYYAPMTIYYTLSKIYLQMLGFTHFDNYEHLRSNIARYSLDRVSAAGREAARCEAAGRISKYLNKCNAHSAVRIGLIFMYRLQYACGC